VDTEGTEHPSLYPRRNFFARYNFAKSNEECAMSLTEVVSPLPDGEPFPADLGDANGIDLHAQYAADRTGGDLFDTVRIGSRVAFLLTDIAGRRPELDPISAAMQHVFRATSAELFSAANVNLMEAAETLILALNHALIAMAKGVRFAPTFVGCYDVQLGVLAYINAGGQTALFCDSEGTRALPNVSMPLGLFTHLTYDASIQAFEPGAMLLVVTKGVTESMGSGNPSGPKRLIELLQSSKYKLASELCSAILKIAHQFEKRRWQWLPFKAKAAREDMTAFAMVRI
jgi:serine phosphatase RsbU (regulator of sigma subunit)